MGTVATCGAGPGAPGGAVGWTPADLGSALVAWYIADTGVYSDAGTTPATNGQNVAQWNDQSGNGYHLSEPSAGGGPTYNTTGFNSRPTLSFDKSAAEYLETDTNAVTLGGGALSVFIVCQLASQTTNGRLAAYISVGGGTDFGEPGNCILIFNLNGTDNISAYQNNDQKANTAISQDTNYRLGSIYDGSDQTMYVNNVAGTSEASVQTFGATGTLYVGGNALGQWDGPVSEVVFTNAGLDSSTRTLLDDYFKAKWGL